MAQDARGEAIGWDGPDGARKAKDRMVRLLGAFLTMLMGYRPMTFGRRIGWNH
jgi:hypothetical protein